MTRPTLAEIYARIPSVACTGQCWRACAAIPLSRAEIAAVEKAAGKPSPIALGSDGHGIMARDDLRCPHLDGMRRCGVYEARPLICRLFGVSDGLPCEFGCVPDRIVPRSETRELIHLTRRARR